MNTMLSRLTRVGLLLALVLAAASVYSQRPNLAQLRATSQQRQQQGNFKEAYDGFRQLCLDRENQGAAVADDLRRGVQCLQRLGRVNEVDELLEATVAVHGENWRLLWAAADVYLSIEHHGFLVAGKFERGNRRGGGRMMHALERDRVRALQLMEQARPLAMADDNKPEAARFYLSLADQQLYNRGTNEAWRLQYLTDLAELPDYEEGYPYFRPRQGAPVDADGQPVFHSAPANWEASETDGQRWRWALETAVELSPGLKFEVLHRRAQFHHQQFGVQTMQQGGWRGGRRGGGDEADESGTFALHTLKESETIARTAIGVRRFDLPDEFNHIKLFQQVAAAGPNNLATTALDTLASIFENRRQYPPAAAMRRQAIERFGAGNNSFRQLQLEQIVGNWGVFEGARTQIAEGGVTLDYRFRNGGELELTAHEIKVEELLTDVKAHLRSDPGRVEWNKINLDNLGYRLVYENQTKYLGRQVAQWQEKLDPRPQHFDRRVTLATPMRNAGAYLVVAKLAGGNTSRIVVWVADTALVRKPLSNQNLYFVSDATTGRPVAGANVEFFGWQQKSLGGNRYQVVTANFAERTSADGLVTPDPRDLKPDYQWLAIARTGEGRLAYFGFSGVWVGRQHDAEYNEIKIYTLTDRPVYRPEQKVHFKAWVRRAQYDQDDVSQFARRTVVVEINNPQGEKLHSQTFQADEWGGVLGEIELPKDAMLGQYYILVRVPTPNNPNQNEAAGGNHFRVEEYKKPEFEVSIEAPTEPVMLGEKLEAKIKAKYYFGSPVTSATVKYTITRTEHSDQWFPSARWDWFFGEGYWWFAYDTPWYPGWSQWVGCRRPHPWFWPQGRRNPPEVVAEVEAPIGPDGELNVEIDTALAKEIHGDQDHQYTITAEVRDQSRRTIVGVGNVLAARKPFTVFTWLDRGYYRTGDVVTARFQAQTLDRQPVSGNGVATLYAVKYDPAGQPQETPVRQWDVDTNDQGAASLQIRASQAGQYRLAYKLTDKKEHTIEGAYLFTIIGAGFDGADFRFNSIELIPEQREYAPGDTVRLQINTDRVGSTVLLFVRPANGVYLPPKVLRLAGKSTIEEIGVVKKDMPNFFVEALTVADGRAYTDVKEIVVPPEQRVLNLAIEPSETEYLPGQEAKVVLRLTDPTGEGFEGSTVVSIYDKSVEYISGGSNAPDIREFFWKWRRHHQPSTQSSLDRWSQNALKQNEKSLQFVGVFGASQVDELNAIEEKGFAGEDRRRELQLGGVGGFGGGGVDRGQANRAYFQEAAAAPGAPLAADAVFAGADKPGEGPSLRKSATGAGGEPDGPLVEPTVRSSFADTALWVGALTTDKTGRAEVTLKMPENLTTWAIRAWAMGHGTKVGQASADVVTRKNLILRLQAPRYFVEKDEVVLSANVHNYLPDEKEALVVLDLPTDELAPLADTQLEQRVSIPAGGEVRVDWRVKCVREGLATVRMKALTDLESDAMELKLPCQVHGMLKLEAWAGTVRPDQPAGSVTYRVPAERRPAESVLEVRYSPTLAGAMVDALPYLADYPYGCTEQTLNRFLPTVITQKVLLDMQLNLAEIRDKRTNLNAQEIGDDRQRAKGWQRFDRNPVFDEAEVARMVKDGVTRLTNMQNSDGGWGWFSGHGERSWPHTTAVVVHGLQIAVENDVALPPDVLPRGVAWLARYQQEQVERIKNHALNKTPRKARADNLDALAYMILVDAGQENREMREFLYRDRIDLAVYAKGMFGLALHKVGDREKLDMIVRNIEQFLVQDAENETAYLKLPADNFWWTWYGSETEANAYYLKLLARLDASVPQAPRLVKYLLNNRKHATYWSSTRDTAVVVEAFADYLRASGELAPDMVVEVWLDGAKQREVSITRDNLFTFDNKFVLTGAAVADGEHTVELRRRGKGPVYFNVYLTNFTLEDPIAKAGLEVKVERKYYKLTPADKTIKAEGARGQAVDQRVQKFDRHELASWDAVASGDLIEIELEIESKNDYEYIVFEDLRPAGCEAVDVRSGYHAQGLGAYMEVRDDRTAFFVRVLARGKHSIAYRVRAEIPGKFSALPARATAMYAPELKGNSDEMKLVIEDTPIGVAAGE